ncbi:unnamed protein product [Blepharisma stoltei]|uniref:3-hydroxyacyl-CoA dehydrogenase n=1 Tax=Blepharisma stoltei TaxID=1481888 RepID=A0AAU9K6M0_9CILI|nr:unnamed protein product [Blepharisma stoltei]
MRLDNAVCVVTGGASGLGAATSKMLITSGAKVSIWDLNAKLGESLAKELGENAIFCSVNIINTESVEAAIKSTLEKFGKISACVNCAGILYGMRTLSKDKVHSLEAFEKVIKVNVIGTFNVARLVAKQMALQPAPAQNEDRGVIINVASVAGYEGQTGQVAYASSKGAILGLALPLARDLAFYKIRVGTIAPGVFNTPMGEKLPQKEADNLIRATPLKRLGDPEEFAHAVKFLIENQYMTGSVIRIDGGIRLPHL